MTSEIPTGFLEVTVFQHNLLNSNPVLNVFGVEHTSEVELDEVASLIFTDWVTNFSFVQCSNIITEKVKVRTGVGTEAEFIGKEPGVLAGEACPPNVSILLRKVTGVVGRGQKGRMYLAGAREADITAGGDITEDYFGDLDDAAQDFASAIATDVGQIHVLHHEGSALSPTPVITMRCEPLVATQRRRLR